jgi:alpha-D-ribose 1-methylphosphonate 5-triphosphate synthase subunit PhnL
MIEVKHLSKRFTLHNQGGVTLPVLHDVSLSARCGECVVLHGPSGAGKSTLLRCVYANYRSQSGAARVRHEGVWVDMASAAPREVLAVRRRTVGYVSQFLRVIPRVPALDVVMEPLIATGCEREAARAKAARVLERLNVPARLWTLPPATFSGGEQQRVNIARGFVSDFPILLLDEPTAALDAANRRAVVGLIEEAKARGAAMLGIFHDDYVRGAVATRLFQL